MSQTPIPPPIPPAPGGHVSGGGDFDVVALVAVLALLATVFALAWPLIRAFARRLETGGQRGELLAELDGLRSRVDQLEAGQAQMAELEERLDFAERLLAQAKEPDRLQR
jgi:Tfp pilus assembly protein PilO